MNRINTNMFFQPTMIKNFLVAYFANYQQLRLLTKLMLCALYSALCTLYSALCTLHSAIFNLHSVLCTLHYVLCTLHSVLCTLYKMSLITLQQGIISNNSYHPSYLNLHFSIIGLTCICSDWILFSRLVPFLKILLFLDLKYILSLQ